MKFKKWFIYFLQLFECFEPDWEVEPLSLVLQNSELHYLLPSQLITRDTNEEKENIHYFILSMILLKQMQIVCVFFLYC